MFAFWFWVVSWHECGWGKGWGFWLQVILFPMMASAKMYLLVLWSLASLPQACRHCCVPPCPWLHGLCCFLLWLLSLLTQCYGVQEMLAAFQWHAGATGDSWVPTASAWVSWPLFPFCNRHSGAGRMVQHGRATYESPIASSHMLSTSSTPWKILWGWVVRQEKLVPVDHRFSWIFSVLLPDWEFWT